MLSSLNSPMLMLKTHKAHMGTLPRLPKNWHGGFLLACAFAVLPLVPSNSAWATAVLENKLNNDLLAGLQAWGSGEFSRFGFSIYTASLWAGADPEQPPLGLRLEYKRSISGASISEASINEMRQLGATEAMLSRWGKQMTQLFPDVKPGDSILGVYRKEGVRFLYNGQLLGEIEDVEFARYFFGIWLDPRTRAPELRAALLKKAQD